MWWPALGPYRPILDIRHSSSATIRQCIQNNRVHKHEDWHWNCIPPCSNNIFLGHIFAMDCPLRKTQRHKTKNSLKEHSSNFFTNSKARKLLRPQAAKFVRCCAGKIQIPKCPHSRIQFYPVVKSFVIRNLSQSLITTYQNKYTLHRSIT